MGRIAPRDFMSGQPAPVLSRWLLVAQAIHRAKNRGKGVSEANIMAAMPVAAVEKLGWDHIDTVLLDLDGTLLDLAFDNGFWLDFIPSVYAASRSLTVEQARAILGVRFRACEGTLPWYCIDYWSRELGLDIAALKRSQAGRIAWLPGAQDFLCRLRASGRRLVLLTNSHPTVLGIKNERTGVSRYLHALISSHVLGAPKESAAFWQAVREVEPFEPRRTLFIDDSPPVLGAARAAGIRWICHIRRASTAAPVSDCGHHRDVLAVDAISDLDPVPPWKAGLPGGRAGACALTDRRAGEGVADGRIRPAAPR